MGIKCDTFYDRMYNKAVEKNLKMIDVANAVGVSNSTLSGWKRTGLIPSADIVLKVSEFLETTIDHLVLGKPDDYQYVLLVKRIKNLTKEQRGSIIKMLADFESTSTVN